MCGDLPGDQPCNGTCPINRHLCAETQKCLTDEESCNGLCLVEGRTASCDGKCLEDPREMDKYLCQGSCQSISVPCDGECPPWYRHCLGTCVANTTKCQGKCPVGHVPCPTGDSCLWGGDVRLCPHHPLLLVGLGSIAMDGELQENCRRFVLDVFEDYCESPSFVLSYLDGRDYMRRSTHPTVPGCPLTPYFSRQLCEQEEWRSIRSWKDKSLTIDLCKGSRPSQLVPNGRFCNGFYECMDRSDESGCSRYICIYFVV